MEYLGASQKNTVWSWCAADHDGRKVYFSIWVDTRQKRDGERVSYLIQEPDWGVDKQTGSRSPARNDHDDKLSLVFDDGYEAYGYFIEAKDTKAHPREIESTRTSFIFQIELDRLADGSILGYPLRRIEIK
jgi:hypothetical protein